MRLVLLCCILTSVACAQNRPCDGTYGKWLKLPILVQDQSNDKYTSESLDVAIRTWNEASNIEIFKKSDYGSEVYYAADLKSTEQGRTSSKSSQIWTNPNIIHWGAIKLNTYKNYDTVSVLIHELGHLAGLKHNGKDYRNTMGEYLYPKQQRRYVDQASVNSINCLYR